MDDGLGGVMESRKEFYERIIATALMYHNPEQSVQVFRDKVGVLAMILMRYDPDKSDESKFPDDRAICPHCGEVAEWNDCSVCGGDGGAYVCYYCRATRRPTEISMTIEPKEPEGW